MTKIRPGTQTDEIQAAVFENSYSTTEVSYSPLVEKQITGDERPSERLFRFELNASEENPEGAVLKESGRRCCIRSDIYGDRRRRTCQL